MTESFKLYLVSWVHDVHRQFLEEACKMRAGQWGNGRIVAAKRAG